MTREIKPCPFCGGEAVVDGTTWRASDGEEVCWISCRSCNGSSPADTPAEAIAAWNRRAETATPTVAEAARALLEAVWRAQIDLTILRLALNGEPCAALRALAGEGKP